MNLEAISNLQINVLVFVACIALMAVVAVGWILASTFIDGAWKPVVIVGLLAVACLGAGWGIIAHEYDRLAKAQEAVADGFDRNYGLKLDGPNLIQLQGIEAREITQHVEMPNGSLERVLFRAVGDEVLPYLLDAEGNWIPMPPQTDVR